MASIFSKIVSGEIPAYKIYETENCLVFLDVFPLIEGHCLVIPKEEVDNYFDLSDQLLSEINVIAKKVSKAIKQVVDCKKIGVAIVGLEVPHAHMHLIPIQKVSDMDFSKSKLQLNPERMKEIQEAIISKL